MIAAGRTFWKMTGSGNDFVFFDARREPAGALETPVAIGALCDRRRGIGADGVVFLEDAPSLDFGIRYFNRDGSLAELCGNASLCAVTLASRLGITPRGEDYVFDTSSGPLRGRLSDSGPEIDSTPVRDLDPSFRTPLQALERRIGFARVGVPHIVVLCDTVQAMDVVGRGRQLRHLQSLPAGANVNFVSGSAGAWEMRTYERGVEDETLACGTGSVATATLLREWGLDQSPVTITTRSGARVVVTLPEATAPRLRGEGRLVFQGRVADIPGVPSGV
jgi:diaminopimelate epimerase